MELTTTIEINSHSQFYFTTMKKIIITLALAGFISLGFTLIEKSKTTTNEVSSAPVKHVDSKKPDTSNEGSDKRLASWD